MAVANNQLAEFTSWYKAAPAQHWPFISGIIMMAVNILNALKVSVEQEGIDLGIPGWLSGLVPAFGPGPDPGDLESSPTSSSLNGVCLSPSAFDPPPAHTLCLLINK